MVGPQLDLMPNEKMVLHSHPHWWYFWKEVAGGAAVIGLLVLTIWSSGALSTGLWWLFLISLVVWLATAVYAFAQWQTTRFAVTDQRVAYQSGLVRRQGVSIPLNRVNNVNFEQGMIARILGNGTLTIESAGETGDSVFENIPDPDRVRTLIFSEMDEYGATRSEREAAAVARALKDDASTAAGSASVEERLAQLDRLRASGAISEEEYAQKRSDILGSL